MATVGNRSTQISNERSAMTSKSTALTRERGELERFPDFPPRDDMQNCFHLHESAVGSALAIHWRDVQNATVLSEVPRDAQPTSWR